MHFISEGHTCHCLDARRPRVTHVCVQNLRGDRHPRAPTLMGSSHYHERVGECAGPQGPPSLACAWSPDHVPGQFVWLESWAPLAGRPGGLGNAAALTRAWTWGRRSTWWRSSLSQLSTGFCCWKDLEKEPARLQEGSSAGTRPGPGGRPGANADLAPGRWCPCLGHRVLVRVCDMTISVDIL